MKNLILIVLCGLTPLVAGVEIRDWEIPIVSQFMVCSNTLLEGCTAFENGDYATAFKTFKRLADNGNFEAKNNVGVLYESGAGVSENKDMALQAYREAAQKRVPMAQYNLGVVTAADHILGTHPQPKQKSQDFIEAYMWFSLAIGHGVEFAEEAREILKKHMNSDEIDQGKQKVKQWNLELQ